MRIYNLLKLIAKLEDLYGIFNDTWIDHGLSIQTIYERSLASNKQSNEYLRYKYHLGERKYKSIAQKASLSIKKKYANLKVSKRQKKFLNWFDKLPNLIQHKIFMLLNHQDLVNFSNAYPKYLPVITKREYWTTLNINLNETFFTFNDLLLIFKYLGESLRMISLEMPVDTSEMDVLLGYTTNLTHLNVKYVDDMDDFVDFIVDNLENLEYLNCQSFDINDVHLRKLIRLSKLKSVPLKGNHMTFDGIQDYIMKSNLLKSFSLKCSQQIEDNILQLLLSKYSKSLENLVIQDQDWNSSSFEILKNSKNIQTVKIYNNGLLKSDILNYINASESILSIEIENCYKFGCSLYEKDQIHPNLLKIKRLCLRKLSLNDEFLTTLSKACKNLEEFSLIECYDFSSTGLEEFICHANNLKFIVLGALDVSLNFLSKVPFKYLPRINFIWISSCFTIEKSNEDIERLKNINSIQVIVDEKIKNYLYVM